MLTTAKNPGTSPGTPAGGKATNTGENPHLAPGKVAPVWAGLPGAPWGGRQQYVHCWKDGGLGVVFPICQLGTKFQQRRRHERARQTV